jgi:hypothetical protein
MRHENASLPRLRWLRTAWNTVVKDIKDTRASSGNTRIFSPESKSGATFFLRRETVREWSMKRRLSPCHQSHDYALNRQTPPESIPDSRCSRKRGVLHSGLASHEWFPGDLSRTRLNPGLFPGVSRSIALRPSSRAHQSRFRQDTSLGRLGLSPALEAFQQLQDQ